MRKVWTFFYGSFMNPEVLAQADVHPTQMQMGRVDGWRLDIAPRATLTPASDSCVYGILAQLTHPELDKLYAKDWFGFGSYLPEAVLVTLAAARPVPAMCYVAWRTEGGKPSAEYLEKMLSIARKHAFPEEYIRHIESFV
jgi:hypothetical protein